MSVEHYTTELCRKTYNLCPFEQSTIIKELHSFDSVLPNYTIGSHKPCSKDTDRKRTVHPCTMADQQTIGHFFT
jgi:hypothetical protein